jgi:sulfoxide reductase heme-binding subunit YedZ
MHRSIIPAGVRPESGGLRRPGRRTLFGNGSAAVLLDMGASRRTPLPWLKPEVFTRSLIPIAAIALRAWDNRLGADPIAQALNQLGLLALVFLVAALGCSPLKAIFGFMWLMRLRRMLGLLGHFAFFYASLHVITYTALDQGFDGRPIAADIVKRKFIFVGFLTFLLLVPLAATSTNGAIRRLGYPRWKRLHRLAYAAPALALVNFIWRVKRDMREPLTYAVVLAILLLLRIVSHLLLPVRFSASK